MKRMNFKGRKNARRQVALKNLKKRLEYMRRFKVSDKRSKDKQKQIEQEIAHLENILEVS